MAFSSSPVFPTGVPWHKGSNQCHKWESHQFCKEHIWQDCAVLTSCHDFSRILHYSSCRLQKLVLPAETYWYLHTSFLSENICSQTNQARCSACSETTIWGWTYGISILHPSKNPLYYLVCSMHTSLSQTAFKHYNLHTPARLCEFCFYKTYLQEYFFENPSY